MMLPLAGVLECGVDVGDEPPSAQEIQAYAAYLGMNLVEVRRE